jgi:hypothetical protein
MKAFTDAQGRAWTVVVNVSAVKRVRDLLDVDLMGVAGGDLLSRLADDPVLLVDVLYVLCKVEADAKGMSDEDFGKGMVGGVLDEAASALMKELLDFFPSAQRARALGKLLKVMEAQDAAMQEAAKMLAPLADAAPAAPPPGDSPPTKPGDSSGTLPASAASTPAA